MDWYEGSIETAIASVRQKNFLLVVLVRDDKPDSSAMLENMNQAHSAFTDCTCLQLNFGTETCKQFNVYYPVLIVPSLYIINGAGLCLEVVAGTVDPARIHEVLTTTKEKQAETPTSPPQPAAPQPVAPQPAAPQPVAPQPAAPQHTVNVKVSDNPNANLLNMINQSSSVPPLVPSSGPSPGPSSGVSAVSLEDKIKRANDLLENKQKEEATAEQEKEKEREKDRRSVGQAMCDQKKQREDDEMRRYGEEMRRKKVTQKAEMDAIRAQIARDKAERRGEAVGTVSAVADTTVIDPSKVKIHIKFPASNSALSYTFNSEDTLRDVVEYAIKALGRENFTLWNTYPRKQYKAIDLSQSLASLDLTGTVNLLGMSGKGYPTPSDESIAPPPSPNQSTALNSPAPQIEPNKPEQCRLQFKMLDGSSIVNAFPVETLLSEAVNWFQTEKNFVIGSASLWCSYPRYEITCDHLTKSLTQLSMYPSAVIFVCANADGDNQVASQHTSSIWGVLLAVLRLPMTILEVLKSFLFPATNRRRPRPPPLDRSPTPVDIPSPSSPGNSENARKRTRLDGNITRLSQQGDEDEDNNVYNGNSTQLQ